MKDINKNENLGYEEKDESTSRKLIKDKKRNKIYAFDDIHTAILSDDSRFNIKEAYKTTRTNIMFALNENEGSRVVALTSSIPGEGKTLTIINTAVSFAMTGAKVLLIDCDLRKAKIHKYMLTENKVGLSNVLGGFDKLEDSIKTSEQYGFDYITAGHTPPNPIELLSSSKMEKILNQLREKYDYIFLDTPPVNIVADTAAMSKMTDGILFVVRHKYTTHDMIYKAVSSLEFVNAKILGFVLNDVDLSSYTYTGKNKFKNYRYKNYYSYNSYYY